MKALNAKQKRINLQAKSGLAKILAIENLHVIHDPSAKTASFDLDDRVVVLPVLKNMTGFMYDAFIAHEISHALYTPLDGLKNSLKQVPHSFINITEDARIEKLIQRRYPGTVKCFYQFYKHLASPEYDFFGLKKLKNPITGKQIGIGELGLIDRINLHFKIGTIVNVPFSPEEVKFVKMVEQEETFDDAVDAAIAIYNHMKSKGQCVEVVIEISKSTKSETSGRADQNDQSICQSSDDEQDSCEDNGQNEDAGSLSDSKDSENDDDGEEQDGCGDNKDDDSSSDGNDSEGIVLKIQAGHTQKEFDKHTEQIIDHDKAADGVTFGDVLDVSSAYQTWITPLTNDKDYPGIKEGVIDRLSGINKSKMPEIDQMYFDFLKQVKPTISLMVNQFNMRKSASDFQKIQISRTGSLDLDNISMYKFNDDLFKRHEKNPDSNNHGMVIMIDWSGSMERHMLSTFKQLIVLTEFCNKVGIPFEVYGFTSGTGKKIYKDKKSIFANQGCGLFHFLSSSMKRNDYRRVCAYSLYAISNRNMSYIHSPGGTPMTHAAFLTEYVVRDFQNKHNPEKMSLIVLSDGEPTDGILPDCNSNVIMRDPRTGKNYTFTNGYRENVFHNVFGYVRDTLNIDNLIGMFITDSWNTNLPSSLCPQPKSPLNSNQLKNDFLTKNCAILPPTKNFDKFFIVSVNNFELSQSDDISKLKPGATDGERQDALMSQLTKMSNSMVFMKLFVDDIS